MIEINQDSCDGCNQCSTVCPRYVLVTEKQKGKKLTFVHPEREHLCIKCGHCMLICPNDSITISGISREDIMPLEGNIPAEFDLLNLFRHRRSIRRYKKKTISREKLERIAQSVVWAPVPSGNAAIGVIIIDKSETLDQLTRMAFRLYEKVDSALNNPIKKQIFKRKAGTVKAHTLEKFVMPGMKWYRKWYEVGQSNELIRDCPALMLFHAHYLEPSIDESVIIAAWQAILYAQTMGIGSCFNGLITPACNKLPDIKKLIHLPESHEVYACITLGYPKFKFERTIRRNQYEIRFLDQVE